VQLQQLDPGLAPHVSPLLAARNRTRSPMRLAMSGADESVRTSWRNAAIASLSINDWLGAFVVGARDDTTCLFSKPAPSPAAEVDCDALTLRLVFDNEARMSKNAATTTTTTPTAPPMTKDLG